MLELTNSFNGQLSAGLSGKGDSSLKESEKLALILFDRIEMGVTDLTATTDWAMCTDIEPQCRTLVALAHAANQATKVGLIGKNYDSLTGVEQSLGLKVCAAFTVVWSGLVGHFQADPGSVTELDMGELLYKDKTCVSAKR